MAAVHHPPFIGADCAAYMTLETRVHWYAIWIKAYPLSTIHFRHLLPDGKPSGKSFMVDPVSMWGRS